LGVGSSPEVLKSCEAPLWADREAYICRAGFRAQALKREQSRARGTQTGDLSGLAASSKDIDHSGIG
jgi:hypothetical protein